MDLHPDRYQRFGVQVRRKSIVKVQVSQFDSDGRKRILIYDRDRKFKVQTDYVEGGFIEKKMGDRPKAFFHAKLDFQKHTFVIGEEAPEQDW
jgi:hypothetical protein